MKRVNRVIYILILIGCGFFLSSRSVLGAPLQTEERVVPESIEQEETVSSTDSYKKMTTERGLFVQTGYWGDVRYVREYDNKTGDHVVTLRASDKGNITGDCMTRPWGFSWATNVKTIVFDSSYGMIQFPPDSREMFKDCYQLKEIDFSGLDTTQTISTANMFENCYELESFDFANIDTHNVTDMSGMFHSCTSLERIDFRTLDTASVTNMNSMFAYCEALKAIDLSGFDTSNVTDMGNMFRYCEQLETLDLSSFDTARVENMEYMFEHCVGLKALDLSSLKTNQLKNMNRMFSKCSQLERINLASFDTTRPSFRMVSPFEECNKLREITLGPKTKLSSYINLKEASSEEGYTGLWGAVGDGTTSKPRDIWTGNVAKLIERSQEGVGDTYVWQPTYYTLSFVSEHSPTPTSFKIYSDETLTKEMLPTVESDVVYYQFKGWTTENNQDDTTIDELVVTNHDITLYARWQPCYSLTEVPSTFYFGITRRNEYQDQWLPLKQNVSQLSESLLLKWYGARHWCLSVSMLKWRNPDNSSDCLDDVQLMFKNTLKKEEADSIPASITHTDNIILSENETIQLVSTTSDTEENDGNWSLALPFNQVFLKIPRYGGREGSYYASQLTWSLDDTL